MAKATMILPNGTKVDIEGTTEEVTHLLTTLGQFGSSPSIAQSQSSTTKLKRRRRTQKVTRVGSPTASAEAGSAVDITAIVNAVKSSDDADSIEEKILDKTSQVDRTLLPLYVVHEYMDKKFSLTSGEINKITTQLGVPIATANISNTLSRTASRYVMADSVRQPGVPVRYQLSRKGVQYMKSVIKGETNEDSD